MCLYDAKQYTLTYGGAHPFTHSSARVCVNKFCDHYLHLFFIAVYLCFIYWGVYHTLNTLLLSSLLSILTLSMGWLLALYNYVHNSAHFIDSHFVNSHFSADTQQLNGSIFGFQTWMCCCSIHSTEEKKTKPNPIKTINSTFQLWTSFAY